MIKEDSMKFFRDQIIKLFGRHTQHNIHKGFSMKSSFIEPVVHVMQYNPMDGHKNIK